MMNKGITKALCEQNSNITVELVQIVDRKSRNSEFLYIFKFKFVSYVLDRRYWSFLTFLVFEHCFLLDGFS